MDGAVIQLLPGRYVTYPHVSFKKGDREAKMESNGLTVAFIEIQYSSIKYSLLNDSIDLIHAIENTLEE